MPLQRSRLDASARAPAVPPVLQEVTGDNFMPLQQCPTSVARTNGGAGQLNLQTRACKVRSEAPAFILPMLFVVPAAPDNALVPRRQ